MNQEETADLQAALGTIRPTVRVVAEPQHHGASLSIESQMVNGSATGFHSGNRVRFTLSDDGPLIRFLRNFDHVRD